MSQGSPEIRSSEDERLMTIRVGWYASRLDQNFITRIDEIKEFLLKHGGNCQQQITNLDEKQTKVKVELTATIPEWYAMRHHDFDSRLNSTTDGFGAGWVEEVSAK